MQVFKTGVSQQNVPGSSPFITLQKITRLSNLRHVDLSPVLLTAGRSFDLACDSTRANGSTEGALSGAADPLFLQSVERFEDEPLQHLDDVVRLKSQPLKKLFLYSVKLKCS